MRAKILALLFLSSAIWAPVLSRVSAQTLYTTEQVLNQWQGAGYPVTAGAIAAPTTIVTTQATATSTASVVVAAFSTGRGRVLQNNSQQGGAAGVEVWVGPSGVTTSTGYYLAPGQCVSVSGTYAIYGITASGSCNLSCIEERP